jgi:hypothetical protein
MPRIYTKTIPPVSMRTVLLAVASFCVLGLLFAVHPTFAQDTAFAEFADASTLSQDSIAVIIAKIIRVALTLTGIIFTVLVIYAGFLYLLARGEPAPAEKAKKILQQSVIGLIIIFSAYGITSFILSRLLSAAFGDSSGSVAVQYSEALSGSLGGGILEDHYPGRNATEIPRNTKIFVTFKEAINPEGIIDNYASDSDSTGINTSGVLIYPTDEGASAALAADEVTVSYDDDFEIFVFDPVDYLGSSEEDVNYTVVLTTEIETMEGEDAFTGTYSSGYAWTFEISTEIDLTPPEVTYVVPILGSENARNITIEIGFNEAMDPVATTGTYGDPEFFTNIKVIDEAGDHVNGTFQISNGYKTIDFTTTDACGEDPCGDTIYCLPGDEEIVVTAKAASIDAEEPPQADVVGVDYDGLVDASGNSLDGNSDGEACGSDSDGICDEGEDLSDDYVWNFSTTDEVEDTVPHVVTADPDIREGEISTTDDVLITFNTFLKSSTIRSDNISMWPDPYYEFWFAARKENSNVSSQIHIVHPTLVSDEVGGWDYWPVLTEGIKSTYQICMYPAIDEAGSCSESRSSNTPYCCNGTASTQACATDTQSTDSAGEVLPNNTETEE